MGATCSSALLPADDELALDMEVALSCALGRFTMRSACTGAAGTGATNSCETLGGVTVGNAGEGIGDEGADVFSDWRLHSRAQRPWVAAGRAMIISFLERGCSVVSSISRLQGEHSQQRREVMAVASN